MLSYVYHSNKYVFVCFHELSVQFFLFPITLMKENIILQNAKL